MSYGYMRNATAMYQQTRAQGSIEGADPHQLTAMLLDGAIDRIAQARGFVRHGDVAGKGAALSKAIAIVGELAASLNPDVGGDLPARLGSLYQYITRRLLQAQLKDDDAALAECIDLLNPVREGWQSIRAEYLASRTGPAA